MVICRFLKSGCVVMVGFDVKMIRGEVDRDRDQTRRCVKRQNYEDWISGTRRIHVPLDYRHRNRPGQAIAALKSAIRRTICFRQAT